MPCCMCEKYEWEDPQEVVYTDQEDGKEYCLFHAPAEHKSVSVEVFNGLVLERIQATFDLEDEAAKCNLSGTIFPGNIDFDDHKFPSVDFSEALFTGRAYFENASFVEGTNFFQTRFERRVIFTGASFEGSAYFHKASFGGSVSFHFTEFGGDAVFDHAEMKGKADFGAAKFVLDANFKFVKIGRNAAFVFTEFGRYAFFDHAEISGEADFNSAKFELDAEFSSVKIGRKAIFIFVEFGGDAVFDHAEIGGEVDFNSAKIREEAYFGFTKFGGDGNFICVEFGTGAFFKSFRTADNALLFFSDCIISAATFVFDDCDPNSLNLTKQYDLTNIHFINSPWEKNGRIKACTEDQEGRLQQTRDFYQRMKAKYKAENNEYEASKWHIAEKEAQRKLLRENGESRALRGALFLYRWSSQFGEDPVLAGKWVLGLIGFVWLLLGLGGIGDGQRLIQGPAWPTSWESVADFGTVFMTLFKNVMLFKIVEFKPQYGLIDGTVLVLTRLVIPLQAALFAFALRNRFRR